MPLSLALSPHHDGSALYVPNQKPQLSDKVKLRIRVHTSLGKISQILIRQSDSGEGFLTPNLKKLYTRHGWDWYEGTITMFNPEVHYRFYIELLDKESYWLNGKGLHELDQPDRDDFKINTYNKVPKWATGSVLYQVFPDRFAKSSEAQNRKLPDWAIPKSWSDDVIGKGHGTAEQIFGGDLKGIEEHLGHLKKLGATILYLTPFFPAGSNHRYDASSFDQVDPLLVGEDAAALVVVAVQEQALGPPLQEARGILRPADRQEAQVVGTVRQRADLHVDVARPQQVRRQHDAVLVEQRVELGERAVHQHVGVEVDELLRLRETLG